MTDAHLEAGEVSRYLAGRVSGRHLERLEDHLSSCESCTQEVAAIVRLRRRPGRGRRWLRVAATVVATASIASVLVLAPWDRTSPRHEDPALRDGDTGRMIMVLRPVAGASAGGEPVLVWRAVPSAVSYRVSLSGEDGDSLWAATTRDTSVQISAGALAGAGTKRYWYVDALLPDGRSLTSGLQEFRIGP